MEIDVIKHFINKTVEVLVAGVWIEGYMVPIVKGVITLMPIGANKEFYGPAAFKTESVQAIRQVKTPPEVIIPPEIPVTDNNIRSSLDQNTPAQRFSKKKK